MAQPGSHTEEFRVSSQDVLNKVRQILHEGNVQRIIIKDPQGKTLLDIPVTVGVLGVLIAPTLAAVGAVAALAADLTLIVERRNEPGRRA